MKKIILLIVVGIFLISLNFVCASCPDGDDCIGGAEINYDMEIHQTCNNCTYCNFTRVKYPNKTVFLSNIESTQDGTYYNYTILGKYNSELGEYEYCYDCGNAVEKETGCLYYLITPTGRSFNTGQVLGGLGIFVGVLATAFAFMFIGSKLGKEDKTLPIGFFFMVMAIFLVIYSLHLGWTFSHDILQHEIISSGVSTIFVVVIWSCTGITIIFFVFMLVAFIKELSKTVTRKRMGDDFNPLTSTYE